MTVYQLAEYDLVSRYDTRLCFVRYTNWIFQNKEDAEKVAKDMSKGCSFELYRVHETLVK